MKKKKKQKQKQKQKNNNNKIKKIRSVLKKKKSVRVSIGPDRFKKSSPIRLKNWKLKKK